MLNYQRKIFLWVLLGCGAALYLRQYLADPSLWLDEVRISLNIIKLPITAFFHQPLPEYQQAAPIGFLVIEKIITYMGGTTEYALRLFPFLSGLASLWLFYRLAKIYIPDNFFLLAILIFVFNPSLVGYSSEVKPYGTDVFFTLFAYVFIAQTCLEELDFYKSALLALAGAVVIWFSFPAVFVLAGIGLTSLLAYIFQKNWPQSLKLGVIFSCWALSFIYYYNFLLHNIVRTESGERYWQNYFISSNHWSGWSNIFNELLNDPVGVTPFFSGLAGILFLIGWYAFSQWDKRKSFFLVIPLVLVFMASGVRQYPSKNRLVLFLVPICVLIITNGIRTLSSKMAKYKLAIVFLLTMFLFGNSFFYVGKEFLHPEDTEDSKSIFRYVKQHYEPHDVLFLAAGSGPAFTYYAPRMGLFSANFIIENQLKNSADDSKKLKGFKRVWIIFTHQWADKAREDKYKASFFKYLFKEKDQLLDHISFSGTEAYLFDLSKR